MSYYRIKIEERNNGQKLYIPQACKLEIHKGWLKQRQVLVWYTIVHAYNNTFTLSETLSVGHRTEESALKVIEDYKNKDVIEVGNKIKSITHKIIE